MSYIRTHFLLLEWISFMLWGIAAGFTICVIVLLASHGIRDALEGFKLVLVFGPLFGSIFWFAWRINMRRLWAMQKSEFDRLFFCVCSLGLIPLVLLILDLKRTACSVAVLLWAQPNTLYLPQGAYLWLKSRGAPRPEVGMEDFSLAQLTRCSNPWCS
jgi:hypothetical protein